MTVTADTPIDQQLHHYTRQPTKTPLTSDDITRLRTAADTALDEITTTRAEPIWRDLISEQISSALDDLPADTYRLTALADELHRELAAVYAETGYTTEPEHTSAPIMRVLADIPELAGKDTDETSQHCQSMLADPEQSGKLHRCILSAGHDSRHRSADDKDWTDAEQYDPYSVKDLDSTQLIPAIPFAAFPAGDAA